MRRVVAALTAAVLAAVVLSACGSSGPAHVSAPHESALAPGAIVLVADGPSSGLGIDNTDLVAASSSGRTHDLTSSPAAESDATWSADGSHVVFIRQSTTGDKSGAVAFQAGVYVWSPGHGAPQRIASCPTYCAQNEFAWSPDDRRIAFVSDDAIKVMNADGSGVHTVCDAARCGDGLNGPAWSPDGHKLVFAEGVPGMGPYDPPSSIWVANADGSGAKRLTQRSCVTFADQQRYGCARDTAPTWSPDGRLIAFSRWRLRPLGPASGPTGKNGATGPAHAHRPIATSLEVMRADGSHLHSLFNCSGPFCDQVLPSAWAPDGNALAYAPTTGRAGNASFRITTLAGKTETIRACSGSHCVYPGDLAWSPNGKELAFIAGGLPPSRVWVIGRDGTGMHQITGAGDCCLAWVGNVSLSGAKAIPKASSPTHLHLAGVIAYDRLSRGLVYSLNLFALGAAVRHVLPLASTQGVEPAWSPNGREIAFGGTGATPNTNIYVADRNGKNIRVLTRYRYGATQPAWSPDGRTIAFEADGIKLVSAAGGHIRSLTSDGQYPSWSPSGTELVFERHLGSGNSEALFTIRPDGSGLRRITNLPGEQRSAVWSPDGKEIAFEWWTPSGTGLYLIRPDGTHLRRVTTAALPQGRPAWSPDSRYLAVISDDGLKAGSRILVIDVKSGRVATVATVPSDAADPSWSSQ